VPADIKIVANAIVSQKQVEGSKLAELTKLSASRINAAVQYLEDYALVKVLRVLGTGPFTFKQVEATGATRRFVANNE
jgi:DNA-binding transcriptional regulator GbsR (MarR family)